MRILYFDSPGTLSNKILPQDDLPLGCCFLFGLRMTDAMATFLWLIKCVYFILTHPALYQTKFYHHIPGTLSNKILSPDGLSLGCCFLFGLRMTDAMVTFISLIKCVYFILTHLVLYQTKFYHQMTSHLGVAFCLV